MPLFVVLGSVVKGPYFMSTRCDLWRWKNWAARFVMFGLGPSNGAGRTGGADEVRSLYFVKGNE